MMGARVQIQSSSQRKLGSILILLFAHGPKVKMDPSLRWDDVREGDARCGAIAFRCHGIFFA
jgi:hypothetical protein